MGLSIFKFEDTKPVISNEELPADLRAVAACLGAEVLPPSRTAMSRDLVRIVEQLQRSFEGEAWHGPSVVEALEGVTAELRINIPSQVPTASGNLFCILEAPTGLSFGDCEGMRRRWHPTKTGRRFHHRRRRTGVQHVEPFVN
jgi:hypothetical protein